MMSVKDGYSNRKLVLFLILSILLIIILGGGSVFALDNAAPREDLWICPGAELSMFSISGLAYGGSLTLGYGNRMAIGVKAGYFINPTDHISTLELNFLLRLYFLGAVSYSGPFIQINGGPTLFAKSGSLTFPSKYGIISAGLSLGWHILIGRYFFIEPTVRGGYPYIIGAGLFAGIHF